jgi:hypothetical protein
LVISFGLVRFPFSTLGDAEGAWGTMALLLLIGLFMFKAFTSFSSGSLVKLCSMSSLDGRRWVQRTSAGTRVQ